MLVDTSCTNGLIVRNQIGFKFDMSNLVFVYGTLKSMYWNNRLLHDSKMVAFCASTKGALYSLGGIPGYKDADHNGDIRLVLGELWLVSDDVLARLDRLEGYDPNSDTNNFYERIQREVRYVKDDQIYTPTAFLYRYIPEVQHDRLIENGIY